jgi:hypothetical protein
MFGKEITMATSKTKSAGEKKPATGKTATTAKKPATKVTAKAPAARKPAAPKAAPPKAAAAKKAAAPRAKKQAALTPEQRYKMIQEAAYFMAEKDAFGGCATDYWIAAEAQIELMLRGD